MSVYRTTYSTHAWAILGQYTPLKHHRANAEHIRTQAMKGELKSVDHLLERVARSRGGGAD
jgi:hypothetical protein